MLKYTISHLYFVKPVKFMAFTVAPDMLTNPLISHIKVYLQVLWHD